MRRENVVEAVGEVVVSVEEAVGMAGTDMTTVVAAGMEEVAVGTEEVAVGTGVVVVGMEVVAVGTEVVGVDATTTVVEGMIRRTDDMTTEGSG